jgi:hypothetical protein
MNELWIIRMLGIFFVMLGIVIRMGYLRKLYFASRGGIYGYIPMGLVFILYTFYEEVKTTQPEFDLLLLCRVRDIDRSRSLSQRRKAAFY